MRTFFGPWALLLTTTTLAVPRLFDQSASPAVVQGRPESQNCPVQFNGLREGGFVERTRNRSRPDFYRLILQFNNDDAARILEVKGTIHGFSAVPHRLALGSDSRTSSGLQKYKESFHLNGTYTARRQLIWPVRVQHVPVVSYIDLSEST